MVRGRQRPSSWPLGFLIALVLIPALFGIPTLVAILGKFFVWYLWKQTTVSIAFCGASTQIMWRIPGMQAAV